MQGATPVTVSRTDFGTKRGAQGNDQLRYPLRLAFSETSQRTCSLLLVTSSAGDIRPQIHRRRLCAGIPARGN